MPPYMPPPPPDAVIACHRAIDQRGRISARAVAINRNRVGGDIPGQQAIVKQPLISPAAIDGRRVSRNDAIEVGALVSPASVIGRVPGDGAIEVGPLKCAAALAEIVIAVAGDYAVVSQALAGAAAGPAESVIHRRVVAQCAIVKGDPVSPAAATGQIVRQDAVPQRAAPAAPPPVTGDIAR